MPLHLHLCDRNTPLCEAWGQAFADQPLCTVHLGDFFEVGADIMVSGGNSLGLMEVGLELAITLKLGSLLQEHLRDQITREHGGFLPVGQALLIPTEDRRWPYFLFAPTMWIPMDISRTIHPYLATRAALRLFSRMEGAKERVWHVLMPGLGTGVGRVPAPICALQMRAAYEDEILGHKDRFADLSRAAQEYERLIKGE